MQRDTDLFGADLPSGTITGVFSMGACCDSCKARPGCGAYTWVLRDRLVGWECACRVWLVLAWVWVTGW